MAHTATFTLPLPLDQADAVLGAVSLELDDGPPGTSCTHRLDAGVLHLTFEAEDVSGLRAALNNALRLLDTATRATR